MTYLLNLSKSKLSHSLYFVVGLLALMLLFWPAPVYAHDTGWGDSAHSAALAGLLPNDALCGPGGFLIEGTDLCTHGLDDPPTDVDGTPLAPTEQVSVHSTLCVGDGVSGKRVQVMYVRPDDRLDRYDQLVEIIRTVAAGADEIYKQSAMKTGGYRRINFVTSAECQIEVQPVTIPANADATFAATLQAMRSLGYNDPNRKYLLFVDSTAMCGIATIKGDSRPGLENFNNQTTGYARIDRGCWNPVAAAHELTHTLGGIQNDAPHSSGGWHCTDQYDLMCYSDAPYYPVMIRTCNDEAYNELLDCNHDDYFHTNPPTGSYLATHWNVANSSFLIAADNIPPGGGFTLTLANAKTQVVATEEVAMLVDTLPVEGGEQLLEYVDHVGFFHNGVLIGTATEQPYELKWRPATPGIYTVIAHIYFVDNSSMTRRSLTFTMEEVKPAEPTIYLPLVIGAR